ncbi:hypothetical protein WR164_13240 [Philodulcilactobacillus myokoensis]|uniref:Uncharacterized protein n=1 Tax=Philodulcilactobacillus myokoensis TaxID=2929573 RepID=A0A9W6ET09_9LACO|nr:hypothetical protein [Philodulcilactobacillus myokoensis]GLB47345.1 hypothetical protein WR164_13240 [Philodulcilactobacillus myokoensis]
MFKINNKTKKRLKYKWNHPSYLGSLIFANLLVIFCIIIFNLTYDIGPVLLFRDNLKDALNDFVTDTKLLGIPALILLNAYSLSLQFYKLIKNHVKNK